MSHSGVTVGLRPSAPSFRTHAQVFGDVVRAVRGVLSVRAVPGWCWACAGHARDGRRDAGHHNLPLCSSEVMEETPTRAAVEKVNG